MIYDDLRCTRAVLLSIDSYWLCANISITVRLGLLVSVVVVVCDYQDSGAAVVPLFQDPASKVGLL